MAPRIVFERDVPAGRVEHPGAATFIVDLGFPCHLACRGCERHPPNPAAYHAARRRLLAAVRSPSTGALRAVFHGGDLFALPRSAHALLAEVWEACHRAGVAFDGVALSDGTAWTEELLARFAAVGVRHYQVALDGPRPLHDARRPARSGGSYDLVLASLRRAHGAGGSVAGVVARMDAALGAVAVAQLAEALDREGLFEGAGALTLFVAPRAPYREQARDLLHLLELLPAPGAPRRDLDVE